MEAVAAGAAEAESGGVKVHDIPVPQGQTREQAWERLVQLPDLFPYPYELKRAGYLGVPDDCSWAKVETDDEDRFVRFLP